MKSEHFETILKEAIENVMGDIINNILKHQIKDELCTISQKIEKVESDLEYIKSRNGVFVLDYEKKENFLECSSFNEQEGEIFKINKESNYFNNEPNNDICYEGKLTTWLIKILFYFKDKDNDNSSCFINGRYEEPSC